VLLYHLQGDVTLANAISKLPEDGAEAPQHVEAFVILFNISIYIYMRVCVCVYLLVQINNKQ